jgi:predicted PolB exonuclease-like 3'-5' exonuclease
MAIPTFAQPSPSSSSPSPDVDGCQTPFSSGNSSPKSTHTIVISVGWQVLSKGAPHCGSRTEADLIEAFGNRIGEYQPRLVTFNGNSFDLPVLRYRALVHRVSCPGLSTLPYFHRYSQEAVDMCDVLSSYGKAKATLHEISRVMGLAGKASGIDGSDVAELFEQGRMDEISAYCLEDVVNTYRIWLAHELFCGRISKQQYTLSDEAVSSCR